MKTEEQDSVVEGEILVVPMTTPDYLPAMQKAAAFVTDEGGVICHAAIVAREMKKPCVIGTKKATTVFHNGDIVEVDGFTGFVRLVTPSRNR
jgi:pyruvate,water dikinase